MHNISRILCQNFNLNNFKFCVDKYKKMLFIILIKVFCSMDLASTTLCEYKRIIEFYFEFFSVQNFKAFLEKKIGGLSGLVVIYS